MLRPFINLDTPLLDDRFPLSLIDPFTAAEYHGRGVVLRPFHPAILYDVGVVWGAGRLRSTLALGFVETVKAAVAAMAASELIVGKGSGGPAVP